MTSILIAVNDSASSRITVDFLAGLSFRPDDVRITLLHVFRKPTASEELMGEKFMKEQPAKFEKVLERAKTRLTESGFNPDNIETKLVAEPYPTVADGIIDQFHKGKFNMVVIGRRKMSKAEEFVKGDPSMKLLRSLEGAAVLVVKSR